MRREQKGWVHLRPLFWLLGLLLFLVPHRAGAEPQAFAVEVEGLGKMALVGEDGPDAVRRYVDGLIRRRAFPGEEKAFRAWGKAIAESAVGAPTVASLRDGVHPVIGIQLGHESDLLGNAKDKRIRRGYKRALAKAGALPVFLPPAASTRQIDTLLGTLDHLLLPGGADVHPSLYGQKVTYAQKEHLNLVRDKYELRVIDKAFKKKLGIDGICRGCQILNVAAGGSLNQDDKRNGVTKKDHVKYGPDGPVPVHHPILLEAGTDTAATIGKMSIRSVASLHHQSVDRVAPGWRVTARSPDGVIEGIERKDGRARCAQFHPERSGRAKFSKAWFGDMVGRARVRMR